MVVAVSCERHLVGKNSLWPTSVFFFPLLILLCMLLKVLNNYTLRIFAMKFRGKSISFCIRGDPTHKTAKTASCQVSSQVWWGKIGRYFVVLSQLGLWKTAQFM